MVGETNWMSKYGCLEEDIRFEMDGWVLVQPPEGDEGLDWLELPAPWGLALPRM